MKKVVACTNLDVLSVKGNEATGFSMKWNVIFIWFWNHI
jgi:hypothetical protein